MAYTLIELQTRDLNIYCKDSSKLIHIAFAGGLLPRSLIENDIQNEEFDSNIGDFDQIYEFEVNNNLQQITTIEEDGLEGYLEDFILMARRGFYSYDKTILGDFEDPTYHLVARPVSKEHREISDKTNKLNILKNDLPSDFNSFNLFEILLDE